MHTRLSRTSSLIRRARVGLSVVLLAMLLPLAAQAQSLPTAFTYQGQLETGSGPVSDTCDFTFSLWDAASGGAQLGSTLSETGVLVDAGYFTVNLDFGVAVFTGDPRYLQVGVQCASDSSSTTIGRFELTATPYALYAAGSSWDGLTGVPADLADGDDNTDAQTLALSSNELSIANGNSVDLAPYLDNTDAQTLSLASQTLSISNGNSVDLAPYLDNTDAQTLALSSNELSIANGNSVDLAPYLDNTDAQTLALSGDTLSIANGNSVDLAPYLDDTDTTYTAGTGLTLTGTAFALDTGFTDARYWRLGGNSSTNPTTDYLGTSDAVNLTLAVNGTRALLIEPTSSSPNLTGGYVGNSITDGVIGAVISGGGDESNANLIYDNYGTIGGGGNNRAGSDDIYTTAETYATVSGGYGNIANAVAATVGGGWNNAAGTYYATVGGGQGNIAGGTDSTVGGGYQNTVYGTSATVAGGESNTATSERTTIGGGQSNTASGSYATVGGGQSNNVYDDHGVVGGGANNIAGDDDGDTASSQYATVGGGDGNTASSQYATVSGGGSNTASGDQSTVSGGTGNIASAYGATVPGGRLNTASGYASFAAGRQAIADHRGAFVWADSSAISSFVSEADNQFRVRATGGVDFVTSSDESTGVRLPAGGGSWSSLSDRAAKTSFAPIDSRGILERVAALPLSTWEYKAEAGNVRHLGPMAQDFHAAFGLGDSDTRISTVDADGVSLAAIQGLHSIVEEQQQVIDEQQQQLDAQQAQLDAMQAQLDALQGGD